MGLCLFDATKCRDSRSFLTGLANDRGLGVDCAERGNRFIQEAPNGGYSRKDNDDHAIPAGVSIFVIFVITAESPINCSVSFEFIRGYCLEHGSRNYMSSLLP